MVTTQGEKHPDEMTQRALWESQDWVPQIQETGM